MIKLLILQNIGSAKDILTIRDVTIIGVLLAIIVVLLYSLNKKDKQLESLNSYVRDQNKENLDVLNNLSNSLGGVEKKVDTSIMATGKVETVLTDLRLDIKSILKNES